LRKVRKAGSIEGPEPQQIFLPVDPGIEGYAEEPENQ
jgi:hypothetical protein